MLVEMRKLEPSEAEDIALGHTPRLIPPWLKLLRLDQSWTLPPQVMLVPSSRRRGMRGGARVTPQQQDEAGMSSGPVDENSVLVMGELSDSNGLAVSMLFKLGRATDRHPACFLCCRMKTIRATAPTSLISL